MTLDIDFQALIEECSAFTSEDKEKAGRNLSNAGVFLITNIEDQIAYPLHWLLHVRGENNSFSDNKRSNQNLRRHIPTLNQLGYSEVFAGEAGFTMVWGAVLKSCDSLNTTPSNRTNGPLYLGRRLFAPTDELHRLLGITEVGEKALEAGQSEYRSLQLRVAQSRMDPVSSRLTRLNEASKSAERSLRVVEIFRRNPDVIAERLYLAQGHCEACGAPAPFTRASDGTPFLEVHHVIPLADGGEDTVENTRALCPNCHRKAHYG